MKSMRSFCVWFWNGDNYHQVISHHSLKGETTKNNKNKNQNNFNATFLITFCILSCINVGMLKCYVRIRIYFSQLLLKLGSYTLDFSTIYTDSCVACLYFICWEYNILTVYSCHKWKRNVAVNPRTIRFLPAAILKSTLWSRMWIFLYFHKAVSYHSTHYDFSMNV